MSDDPQNGRPDDESNTLEDLNVGAELAGPEGAPMPAGDIPVPDGIELDTAGFEPGLELDRSGLAPEPPPPQAPVPGGHGGPRPLNLPGPPPGPSQPAPPRGPRPAPPVAAGSPKNIAILALVAVVIFGGILAVTMLGGSEPATDPVPQQALEDGQRALHQGKWIEAIEAFQRLKRYPTSPEAQEVRDRGLQARAIAEIMEAEPSSTTIKRLEELSRLFPERAEVRERLGEVRKALSSGARSAPTGEGSASADAGAAAD